MSQIIRQENNSSLTHLRHICFLSFYHSAALHVIFSPFLPTCTSPLSQGHDRLATAISSVVSLSRTIIYIFFPQCDKQSAFRQFPFHFTFSLFVVFLEKERVTLTYLAYQPLSSSSHFSLLLSVPFYH